MCLKRYYFNRIKLIKTKTQIYTTDLYKAAKKSKTMKSECN